MSVELRIFYDHFDKIAARLPVVVGEIVRKTTFDIENDVKSSMQGVKSGRVYRRRNRLHQASTAGEAPAIDSGSLVNSIHGEFVADPVAPHGVVYTDSEHVVGLEFGTRRMAARPFMRPAAKANMRRYANVMQKLEGKLI